MAVVEVGGGEDKLARFHDRGGFALRGLVHAVGGAHIKGKVEISLGVGSGNGKQLGLGGVFAGLFGEIFYLWVDGLTDFFGHAIDEEDAVEVVGFMLNATGKKAVAQQHVRGAGGILELNPNDVGTNDVAVNAGERQATLFIDGVIALHDLDLGVGDGHRHDEVERRGDAIKFPPGIEVSAREVDHAELHGAADLLGGEADTGGGVHGFNHGTREQGEFVVEMVNASTFGAEHVVVVVNYPENHGSV